MTFTNYETTESSVEPIVLTDTQKKALTDDFMLGKKVLDVKHDRLIPSSLIKASFAKKAAIEKHVVLLMKGKVLVTPEESHYDDNGEKVVDVEAVYNTVPTTITALKTEAKKAFESCTLIPFNYNIDKIVEAGTTEGTYTAFKAVFN